jgi:hypothetical protein
MISTITGSRFKVQGSGFKVQGSGSRFRVHRFTKLSTRTMKLEPEP